MLFTRNDALDLFEKSKLSYSRITKGDFDLLVEMIRKELTTATGIRMTVSEKTYAKFCPDGLCYGTIYVDANYFDGREAITFERNGFIHFANWASDENVKPFLDAFEIWVNKMTGIDNNGQLNFLNLAHKMGFDYLKLEDQMIVLTRNRDAKAMKFNNLANIALDPTKIYSIPEMYQEIRGRL